MFVAMNVLTELIKIKKAQEENNVSVIGNDEGSDTIHA